MADSVTFAPMDKNSLAERIFGLVPADGSFKGNTRIQAELGLSDEDYAAGREVLLAAGRVVKGRGRCGSLGRVGVVAPPKPKPQIVIPKKSSETSLLPPVKRPTTCEVDIPVEDVRRREEVLHQITAMVWVDRHAWAIDVLRMAEEQKIKIPGIREFRNRLKDRVLSTDDVTWLADALNAVLEGTGTYFHHAKGIVVDRDAIPEEV